MIVPGTMNKKQFSKIPKLPDRDIGRPRCLKTFNTTDTNSNMRCLNHGNIICAVADSQQQGLQVSLNKLNNKSLLKGRNTTTIFVNIQNN